MVTISDLSHTIVTILISRGVLIFNGSILANRTLLEISLPISMPEEKKVVSKLRTFFGNLEDISEISNKRDKEVWRMKWRTCTM